MRRRARLAWGVVPVAAIAGCSLTTDFRGLSSGSTSSSDGGPADAAPGSDAPSAADVVGVDGADAGCTCPSGLVSAYRFEDPARLGRDSVGTNTFGRTIASPQQSSLTPPGLPGYSIKLDGQSAVCANGATTLDTTSDHTLCWWARPEALADRTNQFAQTCGYDTWTGNAGADYVWRINNCNSGQAQEMSVPNVYAAGTWSQICQTYRRGTLTRTVTLGGDPKRKLTRVDTSPIVLENGGWCIGAYDGGGYWKGLVYSPLWFNRVLTDDEIASVASNACCAK